MSSFAQRNAIAARFAPLHTSVASSRQSAPVNLSAYISPDEVQAYKSSGSKLDMHSSRIGRVYQAQSVLRVGPFPVVSSLVSLYTTLTSFPSKESSQIAISVVGEPRGGQKSVFERFCT